MGPPNDTGFHPIATWMVALDLADMLTLRRLGAEAAESAHRIRFADDAPRPGAVDWPLQRDLSYRAHRALEGALGRTLPIELTLEKRIPTGAGLGGGSSAAAGVLWGLNKLFALGLSAPVLRERAAALGSDVPTQHTRETANAQDVALCPQDSAGQRVAPPIRISRISRHFRRHRSGPTSGARGEGMISAPWGLTDPQVLGNLL